MPTTPQQSSSPAHSHSFSPGKILLFAGLLLFTVAAFICVRRRQIELRTARAAASRTPPSSLQPSVPLKKPLCHDVHLLANAEAAGKHTWCSIQPLAAQTPLRHPSPSQKYWRTSIKTESSDTLFHTPPLLEDIQMHSLDALQIAVLIAMPHPPGLDTSNDPNIAVGVVEARFPRP